MMFKYCLPAFWDEDICRNIRLLLTDGCTQEYIPFILNIGYKKTFPKAVHGLCYYHLAIQGWENNVHPNMPKQGKEGKIAENVSQIIKAWVKDWFFTIEDDDEYKHSKQEFDNWIRSLKDIELPSISIDSIFVG